MLPRYNHCYNFWQLLPSHSCWASHLPVTLGDSAWVPPPTGSPPGFHPSDLMLLLAPASSYSTTTIMASLFHASPTFPAGHTGTPLLSRRASEEKKLNRRLYFWLCVVSGCSLKHCWIATGTAAYVHLCCCIISLSRTGIFPRGSGLIPTGLLSS